MQVIIHCGLDKAGSTAIQAHVALYRDWLLRNGVYLPRSGLSGFGHVALFRDISAGKWQPLLDELSALERGDYSQCFLSYEGIWQFDRQSLLRVRDYLGDYDVTLLFYLREQAEIIQSGYLQGLKSAANPLTVSHLNSDYALLEMASRDYVRMLERFESVFGREALVVRPYQPGRWRDGSIVWDLLAFLDCLPDSQFTASRHRQNASLDAQSAGILNVFDAYGDNATAREALVEDLLWLSQKHPGGGRYFLDEAAVQHIWRFYHRSNRQLAERYGVEFDYNDCAANADMATGVADAGTAGVSYLKELADLTRYPRWRGEQVVGPQLAALLRYGKGWSRFEDWGVWSLGDRSRLAFRVPQVRFTGFEDAFILVFRGRYFAANASTQVWINGHLFADCDLREAALKIPLRLLDENRVIRLELRHHAATSPAALAIGDDRRRLAYGLQALNYQFCT
jgi:hypothetical protein